MEFKAVEYYNLQQFHFRTFQVDSRRYMGTLCHS